MTQRSITSPTFEPLKPVAYRYEQATGAFYDDRYTVPHLMGTGYAGYRDGVNDPDMQSVRRWGPLPAGRYTIKAGRTHAQLGPQALELVPHPENEMFGRSDFWIHGDNRAGNRTASRGCIILPRVIRDLVDKSARYREGAILTVVSGRDVGVLPMFELGRGFEP